MKLKATLSTFLLTAALGATSAQAQTTWNSTTTGGNWNTPANWNNAVPTDANAATVSFDNTVATTQNVTLNANGTTSGLSFTNNATAGTQGVRTWTTANSETQTLDFNKLAAGNVAIDITGTRGVTLQGRFLFTDNVDITTSSTSPLTLTNDQAATGGTGALNVLDGTLILNRSGTASIGPRAINVGDGTGAAASANFNPSASNLFSGGANALITVRSDGKMNATTTLATDSNVWGGNTANSGLALHSGAQVETNTGILAIRSNSTTNPLVQVVSGGSTTATIGGTGTFQLDSSTATQTTSRTISVANNTSGGVDLRISAKIGDGDDNMSYTKTGAGVLELTGDSSTTLDGTGSWNINAGGLLVENTAGSATGAASKGVSVALDAWVGGDGAIAGNLSLASGAKFVFSLTDTLTVGGTVTLDSSFGVASLVNADGSAMDWSSVGAGTYTLIDNATDFSTISNFGVANAADLGGGKSAYFQNGSLQLVVAVPEPNSVTLVGLGIAGLMALRRRRHA